MALYLYYCSTHGEVQSQTRGDWLYCPMCMEDGNPLHKANRRWRWNTQAIFQEHYNPAFGAVLHSRGEARELARQASDEQSERLGMTVNYQVHDQLDPGIHKIPKEEMEFEQAVTTANVQGKTAPQR